jgi:hypothetical protein
MIMPPGHAATAGSPWRFSKREKWVVVVMSGLLAALAIAVVISLSTSGHKSGHGCVDVAVAYSTGGSEIYRCGDAAKRRLHGPDGPAGRSAVPEGGAAGRGVGAGLAAGGRGSGPRRGA